MAKCVILKDNNGGYEGKIIRVPDTEAARLIEAGRAKYCSKQEWKEARVAGR